MVRLQVDDLPILWAEGRDYNPDFIVVDSDGTHWVVEVKMDKEMISRDGPGEARGGSPLGEPRLRRRDGGRDVALSARLRGGRQDGKGILGGTAETRLMRRCLFAW